MQKTIITTSTVIIAFVAVFWSAWFLASSMNTTNAKVDSIISFINQSLSKQQPVNITK